jgi:hypothetical protein
MKRKITMYKRKKWVVWHQKCGQNGKIIVYTKILTI